MIAQQQRDIVNPTQQHQRLGSVAQHRRILVSQPNARHELQQQRGAAAVAGAHPALHAVVLAQEGEGARNVAHVLGVRCVARGVGGRAGLRGVRGVGREAVV